MKKFFAFFVPPPRWRLAATIISGIIFGLGAYIFHISNAVSYLSDKPETCINCHIMSPEYSTWRHSSHREWTTCNDCHVPHNNFFSKYYFKAKDGMRHATIFTLRNEPQVIRIGEPGKGVVQENCKRCHEKMNKQVHTYKVTGQNYTHGDGKLCWECHREVPHGRVHSLTATPNSLYPRLKNKKSLKNK